MISFEIVVVDNLSNDGSLEILRSLDKQGRIHLIEQKCSRGRGRQLAFEASVGSYVLDQIDLDDVYKPCFKELVAYYHKNCEGLVMGAKAFLMGPREVLESVGGWRDLQYGEDRDLWDRITDAGKWAGGPPELARETRLEVKRHGSGSLLHRIRYQYERARDLYRVGKSPLDGAERKSFSYLLLLLLAVVAYFRSQFMTRYPRSVNSPAR